MGHFAASGFTISCGFTLSSCVTTGRGCRPRCCARTGTAGGTALSRVRQLRQYALDVRDTYLLPRWADRWGENSSQRLGLTRQSLFSDGRHSQRDSGCDAHGFDDQKRVVAVFEGRSFPYNAGVPPRALTRDELVSHMLPNDWSVVAVHLKERANTIRMPLGQTLVHKRDAPGIS